MSEAVWSELEKLDVIRERFNVTYDEARYALKMANDDLLEALAWLERENYKGYSGWDGATGEWWDRLKEKMSDLGHTQVSLKHNDKTLLSFSAPVGIGLGYVLWRKKTTRILGLAGLAAAAIGRCEWEVEQFSEVDCQGEVEYQGEVVSPGGTTI